MYPQDTLFLNAPMQASRFIIGTFANAMMQTDAPPIDALMDYLRWAEAVASKQAPVPSGVDMNIVASSAAGVQHAVNARRIVRDLLVEAAHWAAANPAPVVGPAPEAANDSSASGPH